MEIRIKGSEVAIKKFLKTLKGKVVESYVCMSPSSIVELTLKEK